MRRTGPGPFLLALATRVFFAPGAAADVPASPGPLDVAHRAWGWLVLAVVALGFAAWIYANHRRKVALERADAAGRKGGADAS